MKTKYEEADRRMTLRLPRSLFDEVERHAKENRRSMNAEIEVRLLQSLQQPKNK